jgi:hypothetical protein
MATTTTTTTCDPRAGAIFQDDLEAQAEAIGRAWLRCLSAYGKHQARPLERLFQVAVNELHCAGREAAAFHLANQARAMAREGVAGWAG